MSVRKMVLIALFSILPSLSVAQEVFQVQIDDYQPRELGSGQLANYVASPVNGKIFMMGGLNNLDGTGNYFHLFGSKVFIDSMSQNFDGTRQVVLRREDGRDFFEVYTTLKATLIPLNLAESESSVAVGSD